MKKTRFNGKPAFLKTAAVLAVLAVLLTACSAYYFGMDMDESGKQATIKAENAGKDDFFAGGSLEVEEGGQIVFIPDLQKGTVRVELIGMPEEQSIDKLPEIGDASITADLSGTESVTAAAAPGSYLIKATCIEKATGTVRISVEAAPEAASVPKSEQTGTAGSNIPLKDNMKEAERQLETALRNRLDEAYGSDIADVRIYIEKMYNYEEEQAFEILKEMNLGPNEIAFEARYDLKPAEGADINRLMIPNGEYDQESGWVKDCTRLGVLRPNPDTAEGAPKYVITDFGTGW